MKPLTDEHLASMNPGIRYTVMTLRSWGFNTCDSGDGRTHDHACDLPVPYVHVRVDPNDMAWEAWRLFENLQKLGIDFSGRPNPQDDPEGFERYPTIEASYSPVDDVAAIHLFNVIIPEP